MSPASRIPDRRQQTGLDNCGDTDCRAVVDGAPPLARVMPGGGSCGCGTKRTESPGARRATGHCSTSNMRVNVWPTICHPPELVERINAGLLPWVIPINPHGHACAAPNGAERRSPDRPAPVRKAGQESQHEHRDNRALAVAPHDRLRACPESDATSAMSGPHHSPDFDRDFDSRPCTVDGVSAARSRLACTSRASATRGSK